MAVVIAGGSQGIGRLLATTLPLDDESLILGYLRNREAAEETLSALEKLGRRTKIVQADVGTGEGAAVLANAAAETGESISRLIHSVVHVDTSSLLDAPDEVVLRTLSVNGLSLLWLIRAARPHMARGSTVLFITSEGAERVHPKYGLVGPPKALGNAYVRQLGVELAPEDIRVNAIAPGLYQSQALLDYLGSGLEKVMERAVRKNPAGRLVTAEEIVSTSDYLLSSRSSGVTGQVIYVQTGRDLLV